MYFVNDYDDANEVTNAMSNKTTENLIGPTTEGQNNFFPKYI